MAGVGHARALPAQVVDVHHAGDHRLAGGVGRRLHVAHVVDELGHAAVAAGGAVGAHEGAAVDRQEVAQVLVGAGAPEHVPGLALGGVWLGGGVDQQLGAAQRQAAGHLREHHVGAGEAAEPADLGIGHREHGVLAVALGVLGVDVAGAGVGSVEVVGSVVLPVLEDDLAVRVDDEARVEEPPGPVVVALVEVAGDVAAALPRLARDLVGDVAGNGLGQGQPLVHRARAVLADDAVLREHRQLHVSQAQRGPVQQLEDAPEVLVNDGVAFPGLDDDAGLLLNQCDSIRSHGSSLPLDSRFPSCVKTPHEQGMARPPRIVIPAEQAVSKLMRQNPPSS